MSQIQAPVSKGHVIQDPPLAKYLFSDRRSSVIWLVLRVWLGIQWVEASLHKISDPKWVSTGEALKGFWMGAVKIPETGKPPIAFDWYRDVLNFMLQNNWANFMGKLVAYGELLIGIGMIVGAFVGVAAFFGAFMNWNFIMAGAASTNGFMLVIAVLLIMAWKVSGYLGADFFLLRWIGVAWKADDASSNANVNSSQAKPKLT